MVVYEVAAQPLGRRRKRILGTRGVKTGKNSYLFRKAPNGGIILARIKAAASNSR
jgi:hypothetical protein